MTASEPIDEARLGLILGELRLPTIKHILASFRRARRQGGLARRTVPCGPRRTRDC